MFVRASILVLAIAASVIAAPGSATSTTVTSSECDTSNLQCCNSLMPANTLTLANIEQLVSEGIAIPIGGSVALGCSPLTVVGLGSGAMCEQQPVCCSNNDVTGLVNVVCSPVNLGL